MIGINLRRIREEKKIGINELGQLTGVNASYISALENGRKNNPSMSIMKKIAESLNVSVWEILQEDSPTDASADSPETGSGPDDSDDIQEILEQLHKRPELKALFSITKNVTKKDIEKAMKIIEALKEK